MGQVCLGRVSLVRGHALCFHYRTETRGHERSTVPTELEAISEDLALVLSRIDAVRDEPLPRVFREDIRLQAEDLLRLAS